MKRALCIVVCLLFCGSSQAADKPMTEVNDHFFLPHDTFWGWTQFDVAPPHNEIDPNLCMPNSGSFGGVTAPCTLFARYMLSGHFEVRPFGKGQLRRFMLFADPTFLFGKNIPQTLYTWSFEPIGVEHSWGAAIYIGNGFEARVTSHFRSARMGDGNKFLGPADLGNNGPWGRYNSVAVRKYFGIRRW